MKKIENFSLKSPCLRLGRRFVGILYILLLTQFTITTYSQSGWVRQSPLPTANALSSVRFINNLTGFICGSELILKTTNSGQLWQIIDSIPNFGGINSIDFFDENTGIAVGAKSNGTGIILRTTNGGNNWLQIPTNRYLS